MMGQAIILAILVSIIVFMFLNTRYKERKYTEYKNDERWQLVKAKSAETLLKFYDVVVVIISAGSVYFILFGNSTQTITLEHAFNYALYLVMFRYPVEYFSLRYYDKTL